VLLISGNTFVATGAQQVLLPRGPPIMPDGPPIRLQPNPPPVFQLEGTGSCAGEAQLPVSLTLNFDETRHLLPSSTAA
jgi:hypothetical protein